MMIRFTIQYPENWVLRDEGYPNNGGSPNTEVLFDISGTSKEDEIFTLSPRWLMVNVEQVGSYFDTDTRTSKNYTLPGYCEALVYVISSDPSDTLIRQNQVTVGGILHVGSNGRMVILNSRFILFLTENYLN